MWVSSILQSCDAHLAQTNQIGSQSQSHFRLLDFFSFNHCLSAFYLNATRSSELKGEVTVGSFVNAQSALN